MPITGLRDRPLGDGVGWSVGWALTVAAALALRPGADGQPQLFEVLSFLLLGCAGFALGGWVSPRIRRPRTTGVRPSMPFSQVLAPALPFAATATLFFLWPDSSLPVRGEAIPVPNGVPLPLSGASGEIRVLKVSVDAVVVRAVGSAVLFGFLNGVVSAARRVPWQSTAAMFFVALNGVSWAIVVFLTLPVLYAGLYLAIGLGETVAMAALLGGLVGALGGFASGTIGHAFESWFDSVAMWKPLQSKTL